MTELTTMEPENASKEAEKAPPSEDIATALYADDLPAAEPEEAGAADPDAIGEGEDDETDEPAGPAIEPPESWKADYQEAFKQLPPELQRVVAERETERDRFVKRKAQEVADTRTRLEREVQTGIAQAQQHYAAQLQTYAQQFEAPEPDPRLLYTGQEEHRILYYQQDAAYRAAQAQRTQVQQQVQEAQQQAEALQQQVSQQEIAEELRMLNENIPEWSDATARTKLLGELESIGTELGYSPELLGAARAVDIIGLKKVAGWKAKADKLDALNKSRMAPVRAAKQLRPIARPGVHQGQNRAPVSTAKMLYPND